MALLGTLQLPGDKSIGHRALMLSLLCPGTSHIINLPPNKDVEATQHNLERLGVKFKQIKPDETLVHVPHKLTQPKEKPVILDAMNSGTTMRLLSGLLSPLGVHVQLTGDAALSKRPMRRVLKPLQEMGAQITGANNNTTAPITISPCTNSLKGLRYTLPIASAQVKSALILAGLFADGASEIIEPSPTRDHTERMLRFLGVPITSTDNTITVPGSLQRTLSPVTWQIPGDISSAAFFMVAASLIPDSHVTLPHVGLNPQRTGIINALRHVGASIELSNQKTLCGEPVGDLTIRSAPLKGDLLIHESSNPSLPSLIDEIPILAIMGCFLDGTLEVRGAEELRKKESDRIKAIIQEFNKLGIAIDEFSDGFCITGQPHRQILSPGIPLFAHHDHRIAMALTVLNAIASLKNWQKTPWPIEGREWAQVSFPHFYDSFQQLISKEEPTHGL